MAALKALRIAGGVIPVLALCWTPTIVPLLSGKSILGHNLQKVSA